MTFRAIFDADCDIRVARAAGIAAIGAGWGYHAPERLKVSGAAHVVSDFAPFRELPGALAA